MLLPSLQHHRQPRDNSGANWHRGICWNHSVDHIWSAGCLWVFCPPSISRRPVLKQFCQSILIRLPGPWNQKHSGTYCAILIRTQSMCLEGVLRTDYKSKECRRSCCDRWLDSPFLFWIRLSTLGPHTRTQAHESSSVTWPTPCYQLPSPLPVGPPDFLMAYPFPLR